MLTVEPYITAVHMFHHVECLQNAYMYICTCISKDYLFATYVQLWC